MDLLERELALASLADSARRAANGTGRLVLISGEAGVGKSTLVQRFLTGRPGAHTYLAACDGLFTPTPLGPLLDVAGDIGGELARLLTQEPEAPRHRLFSALLDALVRAPTPSVLVLEDIHWADEATLDLLRYVVARIRTSRVVVIATYRTDALAQSFPLRVALGELVTCPWTVRIDLEALSLDAVAALAAGASLDVGDLFRQSGGNPFFVTEALRTGLARVPSSVRDAVLARAARLDRDARDLLDVAALTGTVVDPDLLLLAGSAEPVLIDNLTGAGMLAWSASTLTFRHELARRAVGESIGHCRASAIHRQILTALQFTGSVDHARLAFHAEEAGDRATALEQATLAAHQAATLNSHREAAAQLERALRVVDEEPPDRLATRHLDLARELQRIDRIPESLAAYHRAIDLCREAGDPLREGEALRGVAGTLWLLGRGAESTAVAEQALRLLEAQGPSAQLAAGYVRRAGGMMKAGCLDQTIDLARRAREMAEMVGAPDIVSLALNREGSAVWYAGGDPEPLLQRALQVALDKGAEPEAGYAYTNLYEYALRSYRFDAADRHYVDAQAYCAEHEVGVYGYYIAGDRSVELERRGRWQEAVAFAQGVVDQVASPINKLIPTLILGRIKARRGDRGAWELIDAGARVAEESGVPDYLVFARLVRAEALWLDGRIDDARLAAERADDAAGHMIGVERGEVANWLRRLGSMRRPREPISGPHAQHLRGDHESAAAAWLGLGCRYLAALAWYDSGTEAGLRSALDICTDLGAAATATILRRRMRTLGVRGIPTGRRAATRANPLGLTAREYEVLTLLAQGRTNQEIADRLVLSTKTVDHHVSAVLGKLGVARRGQAIAAATRLGLAPAS